MLQSKDWTNLSDDIVAIDNLDTLKKSVTSKHYLNLHTPLPPPPPGTGGVIFSIEGQPVLYSLGAVKSGHSSSPPGLRHYISLRGVSLCLHMFVFLF